MSQLNSSTERKWIVKSENKILGPYSFEQIEDLLKKKQITLIDEVRDMNTRWLYIRECEPLAPVVESIRKSMVSIEDHTKTIQTKTVQTVTGAKVHPIEQPEKSNDESALLPLLQPLDKETATDIAFTESKTAPLKKEKKSFSKIQYVSETDPQVQKNLKSNSKMIVISLSILFLVCIGGVYGYSQYQVKLAKILEQQQVANLKRYYLYGLDNKVIDIFKQLSPVMQTQVLPEIILLIPKLDQAGLINGITTVSDLRLSSKVSDQKKALLSIADFNQAMQNQNYKKAEESLITAKDLDPTNNEIKEDEAIFSFTQDKYDKAYTIFSDLFKNNNKGRLLFGVVLSYLNKTQFNEDNDKLMISEIDRYVVTKIDFKKELLLLSMYLNKRIKKENDFKISYENFVETPVNIKQYFQFPRTIFSTFYSIKSTKNIYEKLKTDLTTPQKTTIAIHNLLELSESAAAEKLFSDYQKVFEKAEDKTNLRILIDSASANYSNMIAAEKTIDPAKLTRASHIALILAKKKLNMNENTYLQNVEKLKIDKNTLSLWAELLLLKTNEEKIRFVDFYATTVDDFVPFQEIKGLPQE